MMNFNFKEVEFLHKLLEEHAELKDDETYRKLRLQFSEKYRQNEEKQRLLKEPVLFEAKYIGDTWQYDDTLPNRVYSVIGETDTQYVIINDSLSMSRLKKEKFEIVEDK